MPDYPLVSIAAINYNNAKYVIETLDSIYNQTYPNIELIIVDDCSTDNSVAVIEDWLTNYKRPYKFIKHEINKGVCAACNSGLKNARGKYIESIATDDAMLPEKTSKQVAILEETDSKVGAVYSDTYLMDINSDPLEGRFIARHREFTTIPSGNIYKELLLGNYIPAMSFMFKASVFEDVGLYDENLIYEDYDMWLRIAAKYDILFSDFISVNYRIRPGSLTFSIKNWGYSNALIYLKHTDAVLPLKELRDIAWHAYINADALTLPLIRQLADKTHDRILMAIYLLWKFGLAIEYGEILIPAVYEHIANGLSPNIVNVADEDVNIFMNEVVYSMPTAFISRAALEAYECNNAGLMPLIRGIGWKNSDANLLTVYLLWRYRIPFADGKELVQKVNDNTSVDPFKGLGRKVISDVDFFCVHILPLVPGSLLREIFTRVYAGGIGDTIDVMNELASKTKDRYFNAICLLWKFKLPLSVGKEVLRQVGASMEAGLPVNMENLADTDNKMFLNAVVPAVSPYLLQQIGLNIYNNGTDYARLLVNELAFKTNDRFLMTIYLLWKFKTTFDTGKEVLEAVADSMAKGKQTVIIHNTVRSDSSLFFTEVVAAISTRLMRKVAIEAHADNGNDGWLLVQELAYGSRDRYVMAMYLLWKYRVKKESVNSILSAVSKAIDDGVTEKIGDTLRSDGDIFLNEVVPAIAPAMLKELVLEAYRSSDTDTMHLVREIAHQVGDRLILSIYLLWKFGIKPEIGEKILSGLSAQIDAGFAGNKYSNDVSTSELFLKEIIASVPVALFGNIVFDAYKEDNKDIMHMIDELSYKVGNRYALAINLLRKLHIERGLSIEMLAVINASVINGAAEIVSDATGSDAALMAKEILPVLPADMKRKIAASVYFNDNLVMRPLVKELFKQTGDRYYKAIIDLWKFKVNSHTGKIILDRIDTHIKNGKSNNFIDICIYKDVVGAVKTSNSYLFNDKNR